MSSSEPCTLCNWGIAGRNLLRGGRVALCSTCVDINSVRTFCYRCKVRMDLSLAKAQELFGRGSMGEAIQRTGMVVFFPDGCPQCASGKEYAEVCYFGIEPRHLH